MTKKQLSPLGSSLLSTMAYFSIFNHPLTFHELIGYCHYMQCSNAEVTQALKDFEKTGIINHADGYYYLHDEKNNILRRIAGEESAAWFMKKARTFSKIISLFPFVRAVFISGSLSKGYMDHNSDIDYFIITEPKRLWLCRTLLVAFKKIFLFNSHKYFCVNYFIDSDHLTIPDQNIFTATELVFTLPMYNSNLYRKFRYENKWTRRYYPNLNNEEREAVFELSEIAFIRFPEKMFSGSMGEWLDTWCLKKTMQHWKNKFKDFDASAFDMELRSKKTVSKHHPRGFQKKVIDLHQDKIDHLEKLWGFEFNFDEVAVITGDNLVFDTTEN